jgi:hypothetical protein
MEKITFRDGNFEFLKGGFPFSQGVRALEGYTIEHARFAYPLPLDEGFATIEAHLTAIGRPRTALCAAELRSPKPFSVQGFSDFNKGYVATLTRWGLFRDELNPVARSNVAPLLSPPREPSFYAFSYTVPAASGAPGFVIAGSAELPDGGRVPHDIAARGDVSASGLRVKAQSVLDAMERRLSELDASWQDVSAVQVYTVHDIHAVLSEQIVPRAGNGGGLIWHYARPPIEELEYEMDVRGVAVERVL